MRSIVLATVLLSAVFVSSRAVAEEAEEKVEKVELRVDGGFFNMGSLGGIEASFRIAGPMWLSAQASEGLFGAGLGAMVRYHHGALTPGIGVTFSVEDQDDVKPVYLRLDLLSVTVGRNEFFSFGFGLDVLLSSGVRCTVGCDSTLEDPIDSAGKIFPEVHLGFGVRM